MTSLAGKTALVTGASRGIGRAIAERLAADGAEVAVHYGSNEAAAADTVKAIQAGGGQAFPVRAELGVDGDVDTLFEALASGLAGRPLDILVNNAAIATYEGTIDGATPELFDREFAINVRAPLFITQRAAVNNVSPGITDTEMNSWLHESDDAVSGVAGITALNRVGASADIGDVVAFFASDDSRWVTGQTVEVNGGLWLGERTALIPDGSNG